MNTLSEYISFYISENITSYTFLLVFKIVESLQCILSKTSINKNQSSYVFTCSKKSQITCSKLRVNS